MSKLLLDDRPLIVLPTLACKIGLNESMMLQQLHYWLLDSKHKHEGRSWIYNTYEGWKENFPFWSIPTIRRALASLSKPYEPKEGDDRPERGPLVLVDRFNKAGFDKTNWYTIDYDELERLEVGMIRRSDQNDQTMGSERSDGADQNDPINTRDYPETTTDSIAADAGFSEEQQKALNAMIGEGVDLEVAQDLAATCPPADLLALVAKVKQKPTLRNPAGYIVAEARAGRWPTAPPGDDGDRDARERRRFISGEYAEFIEH